MATSFYDDQKRRNQAFALAQLQAGSDSSPVQHPLQAVARALQGTVGGYQLGAMDRKDQSEQREATQIMAAMLGGGGQQAAPATSAAPDYGNAIAGIESGGKYDALGPVTKTGDRAYGKYQVMGANIGPWAKAHLGQEMTADQFLANPQAQDAIFKGQFGQYAQKHGPEGAARAWFAGEGGMNNLGAKDQLGTTVGQYGQKFAQAAGAPLQQQAQAIQGGPPRPNDAVMQMLNSNNPYVQRMGQGLAQGLISQQFKPSEYDYKPRDDGSIVAINKKNPRDTQVIQPGNPQDLIRFEADKEAAKTKAKMEAERSVTKPERDRQQKQVADIVTQDIDRAISTIDNSTLPTTGSMGSVVSYIGGTGAHNLSKLLDTVKANAGFQELNKMRQASPTGGALGSITERELALLQATIGNLEQSQDETQLKDNLRRVKNTYLDLIHGPGNGPPRERLTFEERKSAQPSVDDLLKKYGGK